MVWNIYYGPDIIGKYFMGGLILQAYFFCESVEHIYKKTEKGL